MSNDPQDKVISLTGGRKVSPVPEGAAEAASALGLPEFEPGWVWLVGAGPGDPGLLTLHALNALRQADVVVYDALVDETVLQFAGPHTTLEYSGKRGGKPSPKQRDISAKLVELASAGKRVLRLKGGDPFVFGRGGEEALALVDAGIPFRVVPGVTAGVGGLGYAGIPVTHRDVNHAVTFVTGHMAGGDVPENLDWPSIAKGSPVIVLYMALSHLGEISKLLIENGRRADEPVALVRNATLKDQSVLETTLGSAQEDVMRADFKAPAIIVIGDVVKLREGLDWLGAIDGRILKRDPLNARARQNAG
ncbi:uroporphyrinogen-III C-methyltransferase [Parvibaculum sp.]|jgi:uroporphyrin-III C-methyltransferase|uniref:uroporphyrinogen-III C-methyltransferase n=1 Tax=Parvibaculum sp. TaxID=2024848 RepID=UPI003299CAEC